MDLKKYSLGELQGFIPKLRERIYQEQLLDLVDQRTARYEPPSRAVDDVFDRNFAKILKLQRALKDVEQEIKSRV